MKSIMLNGVQVKIGDQVRYINDFDLYTGGFQGFDSIIKPKLGKIYTVRGFSLRKGFFLEEIVNSPVEFEVDGLIFSDEPGFGIWRFEPASPMAIEVLESIKSGKKVNIKIEPEILETISHEVLEEV